VVQRVPAVGTLAASGRTPPLRAGLVERRGRVGRRLAGSLVPQPTVVVGGLSCRLDDVLGPGTAELSLNGGGDRVRIWAAGTALDVDSPELAGWLRAAGATSVVVRPDRVVRSASDVRLRP
jgi:3-(3-hydroxy-phenyl)propionate hydroxylase